LGGLGWGSGWVGLVLAFMIFGVVWYLAVTKRDVQAAPVEATRAEAELAP
jgi:hypothetical protein